MVTALVKEISFWRDAIGSFHTNCLTQATTIQPTKKRPRRAAAALRGRFACRYYSQSLAGYFPSRLSCPMADFTLSRSSLYVTPCHVSMHGSTRTRTFPSANRLPTNVAKQCALPRSQSPHSIQQVPVFCMDRETFSTVYRKIHLFQQCCTDATQIETYTLS